MVNRDVVLHSQMIVLSFLAQLLLQHMPLMQMVEVLDGLLQADRNQQANRDGGNVNQEILPRMRRVRHMNIKHRRLLFLVRVNLSGFRSSFGRSNLRRVALGRGRRSLSTCRLIGERKLVRNFRCLWHGFSWGRSSKGISDIRT